MNETEAYAKLFAKGPNHNEFWWQVANAITESIDVYFPKYPNLAERTVRVTYRA